MFGFDIYCKTFNREWGYGTYKVDNLEILVIDFEKLVEIGPKQIGDFVKNPSIANAPMPKVALGGQGPYGDIYERFRSSIVLPKEFVYRQYSSKYAKFFYSEEKLEQLSKWWMRAADQKT